MDKAPDGGDDLADYPHPGLYGVVVLQVAHVQLLLRDVTLLLLSGVGAAPSHRHWGRLRLPLAPHMLIFLPICSSSSCSRTVVIIVEWFSDVEAIDDVIACQGVPYVGRQGGEDKGGQLQVAIGEVELGGEVGGVVWAGALGLLVGAQGEGGGRDAEVDEEGEELAEKTLLDVRLPFGLKYLKIN